MVSRTKKAPIRVRQASVDSLLWWLLAGTVVAIPFVTVVRAEDPFRLPRELLLEGVAITVAAIALLGMVWSRTRITAELAERRPALIIAAAAVVWTAVTAAVSTQRVLSLHTLIWVSSCAVFFVVLLGVTAIRPIWSIWLTAFPAVSMSLLAIAQRLQIWSPFVYQRGITLRFKTGGFLGNPDDLASYLLLPAVAAITMASITRGAQRIGWFMAAVVIFSGIIAAEALTAFAATAVAVFALAFLISRRVVLRLVIAAVALIAIAALMKLPLLSRISDVVSLAAAGKTAEATSLRSQALLAAARMVKEHPLAGVGPGCFGYWYLPYKVELVGSHPEFMRSVENFHEVHNDHLQLMATTGLPGYLIFLAALWQFARISIESPRDGDERLRFARHFALPAAAAFFTLTLAQFPLELAPATIEALFFSAVAVAWSRPR